MSLCYCGGSKSYENSVRDDYIIQVVSYASTLCMTTNGLQLRMQLITLDQFPIVTI